MPDLPAELAREVLTDRIIDQTPTVRRTVCILTLALLGSTWPLWIPQHYFPQVPLFAVAGMLPDFLQWAWLGLALVGLLVGLFDRAAGRWWRAGVGIFAGSMAMLWVFDQHRLQPWAYQSVLISIVLCVVEARRAIMLLRLLTVSIYVYSAISKFDYTFLHSLGQQFTQTLLQLVNASSENWTDGQRVVVALLFPVGELVVALLLAAPFARRIGMFGAIGMHTLLLLVLGPLGMKQQPAVLIWNVEFILLVWFLFRGIKTPRPDSLETSAGEVLAAGGRNWPGRVATAILLFAVCFPLAEPFGYCDHWLAWQLYSPGASRAQVFVRVSDAVLLPSDWQPYISHRDEDETWLRLRLDRWSLETLHAPLYPQARFQLGVALAVAEALPSGQSVRVEIFGAANRFNGERDQTSLHSQPQLEDAAQAYWVNATPAEK